MHVRYALLLLIPALAGCQHEDHEKKDTSTFTKRMECARLSATGDWEDVLDGPYLDKTYYSPSLDTCVFVMKRSHRGEKDGSIHNEVHLVDALSRKEIWENDPETGEATDQITPKLNEQLQKLQINP